MRVGFVTTSYPSDERDARGAHVHRLALSLKDRGLETVVVAVSPHREPFELDGVEVRPVGERVSREGHLATGISGIVPNLRRRPWLAREIPHLLAELKRGASSLTDVDVIHAHWLMPTASMVARAGIDKPLFATAHGGDVNLVGSIPWLRNRLRDVANECTGVVAVSERIKARLSGLGVSSETIKTLPVGVGLRPRVEPKSREGPLRVLYVGGLSRRKSVGTLIQAVSDLDRSGAVVLRVAGDGPSAASLRRVTQRLGLKGVSFLGVVPPNQVYQQMDWAEVLVLPSTSEGTPTVVMEALASGLPVVATNIPGTRDLIVDNQNGFLFDVNDVKGLRDLLAMLVDNRNELDRIGALGFESASDFSVEYVAGQYEAMYEGTQ